MKRIFAVLFVSSCVLLFGDNLIQNGSFESGLSPWSAPEWLHDTVTPKLDSKEMPGPGTASLCLAGEKGKRPIVYQLFKLPQGKKNFKISFKLKTRNLENTYAMGYVQIDKVKNPPFSASTYPRLAGKKDAPWTPFEGTFSIPDGAGPNGRIYFVFDRKAENGILWIDDVNLEALDEAPSAAPVEKEKVTVSAKPSGLIVPSGLNYLEPSAWSNISWMPNNAGKRFGKNGDLFFELQKGQCGAVQARITSIVRNCEGPFRFSCRVKTEGNVAPMMNISVPALPSEKRKALSFVPKTAGSPKDGWTEYICDFSVPFKPMEIAVMIRTARVSVPAKITFKDLTLEPMVAEDGKVSVFESRPGGEEGIFLPGEEPFCEVLFRNGTREKRVLPLNIAVTDYFGKKAVYFEQEVTLEPMSITRRKIAFPMLKKIGFYAATVTSKALPPGNRFKMSVVLAGVPPEKADPFFGITFMAPVEPLVSAMQRLGVGTKGVLLYWNYIETPEGTYDWSAIDLSVEACRKAGIRIQGGFLVDSRSGVPPKYRAEADQRLKQNLPPYTEEYFSAAKKFVEAAAARYKGKIDNWSAVTEINLTKDRDPHEYAHYVRRIKDLCAAVKSGNPAARVFAIGCSGGDGRAIPRFPVLRDLWLNQGLSECLDGVGLDQYTSPQTFGPGYKPANSETGMIREIMLDALRIVRSKGKSGVSIDEKGFNMPQHLEVDEPAGASMGNILAREYVVIKSIPEVSHWMYFMWRQWRADEQIDWGLWLYQFPRQGVSAYAAVARMFAQAEFVAKPELHKQVPCYVFRKNGKTLCALWHSDGTGASMILKLPGKSELFDVQGNPIPVGKDAFELKLTEAPVYILSDASVPEMLGVLTKADVGLPEVEAALNISRKDTLELLVRNLTPKALTATVQSGNAKKEVVLESGAVKTIPFQADVADGKTHSASVVTGKGRVCPVSEQFTIYRVPRVSSFGELEKQKPFEILDDPVRHMSNVDFVSNKLWTGPEDCSAELRMGYDDQNLYLNVRVKDEFHWNGFKGPMLWAGDSIQFALDPKRDARVKKMNGKTGFFDDDFLFSAALADGKSDIFCHVPEGKAFPVPAITRDESAKITNYNVKLPWKSLGIQPEKGRIFGFDVIVLDSDLEKQVAPYWMQLTPGIAGGQHPELFAGFLLE